MCPRSDICIVVLFVAPSFQIFVPSFRSCTLVPAIGVQEHPPKPPFRKSPNRTAAQNLRVDPYGAYLQPSGPSLELYRQQLFPASPFPALHWSSEEVHAAV